MKHKKQLINISLIFIILITAVIIDSYYQAYYPRVVTNQIEFEDLPQDLEDLNIVFVSDIHYGPDRNLKWLQMIVQTINEQDPDIVLLGGDYIEYHASFAKSVMQDLGKINAPLGIYAVMGNHDYFRGIELMPQAMEQNNIHLIDNTGEWIQLEHDLFYLGGIADPTFGHPDYQVASQAVSSDDFFILLSHNPDLVVDLPDNKPDLALSGHTHGGQITLFGKWAPYVPSKYGNRYLSGLFDIRGMKLLVSNGVGTFSKPFRWFAPAQIHRIQLIKQNEKTLESIESQGG